MANAIEEINLSDQKIGSWNIEEKIRSALTEERCKSSFKLILSDNCIDDSAVEELVNLLITDNCFAKNLNELDLSNNRLTNGCFSNLIQLLKIATKLQHINLSINAFEMDDFGRFFSMICSVTEDETEQITIAQKIVWLPESWHADRFFSEGSAFFNAHNAYWQK